MCERVGCGKERQKPAGDQRGDSHGNPIDLLPPFHRGHLPANRHIDQVAQLGILGQPLREGGEALFLSMQRRGHTFLR